MQVGEIFKSKDSLNFMGAGVLPHSLHTNTSFVGKKDENLVARVLIGRREEVELVPAANQEIVNPLSISQKEQTRIGRTLCYPSESHTTA